MVKGGEFEKQERKNLGVFKYDAAEGWIRSGKTVT